VPVVEIKVIEGEFSKDETKKLIADVTDVFVSFLGECMRDKIWVMVQEIEDGRFGVGGQVVELADIRALQAGSIEKAEEF
jgi:4-oxalocrotonate tautomerase